MCEDKRAKLPRVRLHFDARAAGPHRGESVLVRGVGIERSGAAGLPAYLAELAQDFVAVYLGPRCAVLTGATWPNGIRRARTMRNRHMYNSTHAHKHTHRHSHTKRAAWCACSDSCVLPAPSECRCMSQSSATSIPQLRGKNIDIEFAVEKIAWPSQ